MTGQRATYGTKLTCRECGTEYMIRCPVCSTEIRLDRLWVWMVENCVEVTREQRQSMARIIGEVYE